jgi:hypothetical protein
MLNLKDGNVLAFPQQLTIESGNVNPISGQTVPEDTKHIEVFTGMTLRDYFAAAAIEYARDTSGENDPSIVAHLAFEIADAMLKERIK